jgi:hypothetical protein
MTLDSGRLGSGSFSSPAVLLCSAGKLIFQPPHPSRSEPISCHALLCTRSPSRMPDQPIDTRRRLCRATQNGAGVQECHRQVSSSRPFLLGSTSSAAFVSCHSGAADSPCNATLGSHTTSQRPTISVPCMSHAHLRAKRATFRAFSADGGGGTKAACATNCRSFPRASSRFDAWERVRCEHNHSVTRTEASRRHHPQSQ